MEQAYQNQVSAQGAYTGEPIQRPAGRDHTAPINQLAAPTPPNKIRDIHITALNHGYVVAIGCSNFAIEKASDLISKLSEYLNNPATTEKKWEEGKLF